MSDKARKLGKSAWRVAEGAAILVTLVTAILTWSPLFSASRPTYAIILASTISLIAVIALVALAYREWCSGLALADYASVANTNQERAASIERQGDAILHRQLETSKKIKEILSRLDQLEEYEAKALKIENENISAVRVWFRELLDEYKNLFEELTNSPCRTCIKLVYEEDQLYVFTFARDSESMAANWKSDKDRWERRHDLLEKNSDFLELWSSGQNDENYRLYDNMPENPNYLSTSLNYFAHQDYSAIRGWRLWYRSALVFPIRQENHEMINEKSDFCIGFFCVDSSDTYVFNDDWLISLGRRMSHELYHPLRRFCQLTRQIDE